MIALLLIVSITGLWLLYLYILTFYFSLLYFTSTLIFRDWFIHLYLGPIADYPSYNTTLHLLLPYYISYMPLLLHIYLHSRTLLPHCLPHISLFYYLPTGRGVYRMLSEMIFIHFILISFYLFTYY